MAHLTDDMTEAKAIAWTEAKAMAWIEAEMQKSLLEVLERSPQRPLTHHELNGVPRWWQKAVDEAFLWCKNRSQSTD